MSPLEVELKNVAFRNPQQAMAMIEKGWKDKSLPASDPITRIYLQAAGDLRVFEKVDTRHFIRNLASKLDGSQSATVEALAPSVGGQYAMMPSPLSTAGGSSATPFTGDFDGNGYSISGLYFNNSSIYEANYDYGFFGYIKNCIIENININNLNFYISSNVFRSFHCTGALAGKAENCTITNSTSTGSINKGWAGHVCERYLGIPINSSQSPNFGSWELKSIPLKISRTGELKFKETMAITMIDAY